jgi:hypothetical protein
MNPRGWKHCYNKIVIISETFCLQGKTWGQLSPDGITVHLKYNANILQNLLDECVNDTTGRQTLLLLDDVGESVLRDRDAMPIFHRMCTNGRHCRLSIVFLSQKMCGQVPTVVRSNTDCAIFFGANSYREQNAAFEEFSMMPRKEFNTMFQDATREQYSTLTCVMIEGKLRYFKNLDHEIK